MCFDQQVPVGGRQVHGVCDALQLGRAFSVLTRVVCSLYKGHANTSSRGADSFVALCL
jgi:hypothetical protein